MLSAKAPLRAVGDTADDDEATNTRAALSIDYGNAPTPANDSQKYVDDVNFKMDDPENPGTQVDYYVVLDQAGNWTWDSIVEEADLPQTDASGNKYYYYIKSIEETGMPNATVASVKLDGEDAFIVGIDKHFNSTTNTPEPLEVYNEVKGSLNVQKKVQVNGADVAEGTLTLFNQLVDGDYTFTIAGKSGTDTADEETRTITVTVSNGLARLKK